MTDSIVSTLRAMAHNYAGGHSWDHLDGEAVSQAADEIERLRADVEQQRRLKMHVAENLQNALDNCSVYRTQLAEQSTLLQVVLTMINRGIVSFDDQIEYRQKLAALSSSAEPSAPECGNCAASTVSSCNDNGCGYLEGGNGEPSAPVEIDERAALEAYCAKVGLPLDVMPTGEYLIPATRFVSQGWHAHAAATRQP